MSRLVIFGATGDLCRRKLIPALHKLWEKKLLPSDFVVTGCARREPTRDQWIASLGGDYPQEFLHLLDYQCADLSRVDTLKNLKPAPETVSSVIEDTTYFLSVPPERYSDAIQNLKEAGLVDDQERSRVIIEKPFGTDYKSAEFTVSGGQMFTRETSISH